MEITEIKIYPQDPVHDDKLKAFATITLDNAFVIRDLKIIEGKKGLFVAMPSAKVSVPCKACGKKNPLRNRYCGFCGVFIEEDPKDLRKGKREDHRDVAHPINNETREYVHNKILEAYYHYAGSAPAGHESTYSPSLYEDNDY
ncbi:MAG: SpoVG family protein [Candidatus Auribacterota bacterium]|jgi:stage V sporulation protein G